MTTLLPLDNIIKEIDDRVLAIIQERDKLSNVLHDLESLIESCDEGIVALLDAKYNLQQANDSLSQYL